MDNLENLSDGELDKRLHIALDLGCWHEWGDPKVSGFKVKLACQYCGLKLYRSYIHPNPAYCSPKSARSLVDNAQERVIKKVGEAAYWDALYEPFNVGDVRHASLKAATAPARQRVLAMLRALTEVEDGN